jgi:hypothetical protein
LENLKSSLQAGYKSAGANVRKVHYANKTFYDFKSTIREYKVGDEVFLYNPARKSHRSKKF